MYSACSGVMPCSPMWFTFHSFHRNSYRTDITIRKVRPPAKTGDGPLRTNHAVTGRGGRACRHATCRTAAVWFPSAPAAGYHVRAYADDADAFCEGGGDGGQHRVSPRAARDCGRLLGGPSRSLARGNDEIDLSPNEVGCEVWQLIQIVRIAWRKPDILALDPTQLAQRLHEGWLDWVDALSQKSNGPYSSRLLSVDSARCPECTERNPADGCSSIHELVTKPARINRSLLRIRPGA